MRETRIAIVVQGRFHAFALAKAMIEKGSPVQVLTNYPAFFAARFGLPSSHVQGCAPLGLLHRYANRWNLNERVPVVDRLLHQGFSLWAARHISKTEPMAVHVFSGVALELFEKLRTFSNPVVRLLMRGSEHIVDQYLDLEEEGRRAGTPIEKPSPWMVRRELMEYAMADHIITLSNFARKTFLNRGFSSAKINLLPLATNVSQFRPTEEIHRARQARIRSGARLQILCTGTASLQKGILDFVAVARKLKGRMSFRWIGNVAKDAVAIVNANSDVIEFIPRVPETELPGFYHQADGYMFPTIQDGFAVVLAQAKAACLPTVASEHSAAPDLIEHGVTGWNLPFRRPDLFEEKLASWDANRESMSRMTENLWRTVDMRDWSHVAEDFISIVKEAVQIRRHEGLWEA